MAAREYQSIRVNAPVVKRTHIPLQFILFDLRPTKSRSPHRLSKASLTARVELDQTPHTQRLDKIA